MLSPRDLCGLEFIPNLYKSGVSSLKIEGRMKTPEYVAAVTKIYRKYIDLFFENEDTVISEEDKKTLIQVFNRGNFSLGHLDNKPNRNLIFSSKSNNMGIYLGKITNYNNNKGHIKVNLNEEIAIGDTISIEGETGTYTISEIILNNQNLKSIRPKKTVPNGTNVTLGRMKGNIKTGCKVYKISSKALNSSLELSYKENSNLKRIPINCFLSVKRGLPITLKLQSINNPPFYNNICIEYKSNIIPEDSINSPTPKERICEQISKLGNTPYFIQQFEIDLDDNLHIPHISDLNTIRRNAIEELENKVLNVSGSNNAIVSYTSLNIQNNEIPIQNRKISVLLEIINSNYNYSNLTGFDNIYIPLKSFFNKNYFPIIEQLSKKFNLYVYMPTIIKENHKNLVLNKLDEIISLLNINGFVISNVADFIYLDKYIAEGAYDFVANYTINIFNNYTTKQLETMGISTITPSIELNETSLNNIINTSSLPVELIAYGRSILMNSSYCLLGKTNKCYPECERKCTNSKKYYLKDRLGFKFRILPDNIQTVTSLYNSKITSIDTKNFNIYSTRINILDENIEEINKIVKEVKLGNKLEGKNYTNGNLNRSV